MSRPLTAVEYRLLVEHSPVMVWRARLDAKCDYFNETWLRFTGRTLEQEIGDGWAQGVHPDDFSRCVDFYLDHFKRRVAFEMEYRLRRHDGVYRWIFDRGVPFCDDDGRFAGFIGSCVDVEERRRVEAERERREGERLALAEDFERWILAIVSHDIRNPLNAIQITARHLQHIAGDPAAVKKAAERVKRGVDRIAHIVSDLLDLSRERQGGGILLTPLPGDMKVMCQEIVEELRTSAADRTIEFECVTDGAGLWDEHRVMQAITNLASNAIQHGTPSSPVAIRLSGDERKVVVEVRNDGTIPGELLPRIFDAFRSGHGRAGRGQGLGLGLFIANAIARAHDGTISVESTRQAGTTFRLELPRRPATGIALGA